MPKELQKFTTNEYGDFWMEVEVGEESRAEPGAKPPVRGLRDAAVTQDAQKAASDLGIPVDFDRSILGIMPMIHKLRDMANAMNLKEVEVEVGAKFATKINLFVVSGGADVDFKVKFKWEVNQHKDEAPHGPDPSATV